MPFLNFSPTKGSLAGNLLRVTLTFYLSLAFLLTLGQLILEYQNEKRRLGNEIEKVASTFNPIISKALWNVDDEQTLASIQGMLSINHDLKEIELRGSDKTLLYRQAPISHKTSFSETAPLLSLLNFDEYHYSYEVTYASEYTEENVIGYLTLKSNSLVVLNRAAHTFFITVISAIFKTTLLCIIFYLIINKIVGKPLKKVTDTMRDFDASHRKPYIPDNELLSRDDELGVMVKTFNAMTNALIVKDNDLNTYSQGLEKKVRERTSQLEQASQAKSEFLAAMSHEIRTPMNGVLGLVNLLGETPLSQEQRQYLEIIERSGESLIDIINDVLDNLKIESKKIDIEKISFNLEIVFNESISLFLDKSMKSNVDIFTIYSPNCPQFVMGDPTRIRQVIINLLGNAFKFTEKGCITLQAQYDELSPNFITISISDTGIGIKESVFDKLFLPYGQADSSTTRLYGGTGLGLCICKQLVELMGGAIGIESEIDQGSTFWFRVPLVLLPETKIPPKISATPIPLTTKISLFVDNSQYANHLENLLSYQGIPSQQLANTQNLIRDLERDNKDNHILILKYNNDKLHQLLSRVNNKDNLTCNFSVILINATATIPPNLEGIVHSVKSLTLPFTNANLIETIIDTANGVEPAPHEKKSKYNYPDLSALQVLVAEDNPVNQMVIQGYLKKYRISSTLVETGNQAIEACLNQPQAFDLILMDGEMPELNGWLASEKIRELNIKRPNGTPIMIIALSAHAMESHKAAASTAGMDGFLSKPVNQAALEEVLMRALNSQ